jgi:hypothetical protein
MGVGHCSGDAQYLMAFTVEMSGDERFLTTLISSFDIPLTCWKTHVL